MKRPTWQILWNDEMCVGIPEVDEDHRRFISLIHEFNRSITERMESGEIKKRLQFIVDNAERHFAHEEKLFKEWQYPDTNAHALLHAQELQALKSMMNDFIPYSHDSGWINEGLKIKSILMNHIKSDMKYADFYRTSFPSEKQDSE